MELLSPILHAVRDFLAPDICPLCQKELANPQWKLCDTCHEQLPLLPEKRCPNCGGPADSLFAQCRECLTLDERPWQLAVSAFSFDGIARTAIHKLKYRNARELAPALAGYLARDWMKYRQNFRPDVVSAVPIHWWRWLKRGYNQAVDVARFLARDLDLPFQTLLRRTRYTTPQAELTASERLDNLGNAFAGMDNAAGKYILLVDDVFTTGSTLAAATQALLKKKAKGVAVITIARDL